MLGYSEHPRTNLDGVIGFKTLCYDEHSVYSPYYPKAVWVPENDIYTARAKCMRGSFWAHHTTADNITIHPISHRGLVPTCQCGIYGAWNFAPPAMIMFSHDGIRSRVERSFICLIRGAGQTIVGSLGWRCTYAEILGWVAIRTPFSTRSAFISKFEKHFPLRSTRDYRVRISPDTATDIFGEMLLSTDFHLDSIPSLLSAIPPISIDEAYALVERNRYEFPSEDG